MTPAAPTRPGAADAATSVGPDRGQHFAYQPALDGVRALAIVLVLCFHGGWSWMTGGYVGVSVFFTLSGFLITNLLLLEHERTGSVSLGRFFSRRVKRLLPASLVCLAAISVLSWRGWFVATDRLRGDIVAAALQVANWRALTGDLGYADLVADVGGVVGPVDHFWSLSIEEQFYWVWPIAALLLWRAVRAPRSRAVALVVLAGGAALCAPVIAQVFGPDAAYWATPARLGEILVGAALAGWTMWRQVPRWAGAVGLVGACVVVVAAVTWPAGSGPAYEGWLPVFALASAAVVFGVQRPGPLRSVFAVAPLAWLGRISYGVYLYHWPLFALIDTDRTGLDGWSLFALRVAVTLLVAEVSFRWFEQPLRRAEFRVPVTLGAAGAATAAVVGLALLVVPGPRTQFTGELDTTGIGFDDTVPAATGPTATVPDGVADSVPPVATSSPLPSSPVGMLLIGDSTATALGSGLVDWVRADPATARVESVASIGCGVMRGSRSAADVDGRFAAECDTALGERLDEVLATGQVDLAVVFVTLLDAGARVWDDDEGPIDPDDPRFVERRRADYEALLDRLAVAGVDRVAWILPADPAPWWVGYDPANTNRVAVPSLVTAIEELAADRPELVHAVPFGEWLAEQEASGDRSWRPDGLHLSPEAALRAMDEFLGDALLEVARS